MLLIDTILLSPIYGTIWAARQVHKAIEQNQADEPARITAELGELYMMLETGRITEAEFGVREKELLDLLEELQEGK
jgi:Gas vesicle protein G